MENTKTDYLVTKETMGRNMSVRRQADIRDKPLCGTSQSQSMRSVLGQTTSAHEEKAKGSRKSDNRHSLVYAEATDSITDILTSRIDGFPTSQPSVTTKKISRAIRPAPFQLPCSAPVLQIASGTMKDRFLRRVWGHLSQSESTEQDVYLRDDIRISKLFILELDKGTADAWRYAFWQYMGITPERWQGIRAEREAYQKSLGPTLAEQLKDPQFLASLESGVRSSLLKAEEQMRLDFHGKKAVA